MSNIYRELCERIDEISFGFPKSRLRTDIALIKSIFTKEDAKTFLMMEKGYHTAKEFAVKNSMDEAEALEKLNAMAMKGLIFRRHNGDELEFKQYPFVVGFLEFQVHRSGNNKFLMNTGMYMISSNWGYRMSQTMPFERSVPMHKEYVEGTKVLPFDDIEAVLNKHTRFAVADCICRTMYKMEPWNKCKHPLETCFSTDDFATFYIETGIGREVTKEEVLEVLRQGEKDGRVISITNSQDGENICSCCKCGCGMLYMKKKYPGPSGDYWSNYYSVCDFDKCVGCGVCQKRCPVDAISFDKKTKKPTFNSKSCIGCGLCVSTCPGKAIMLRMKAEDKLYTPPLTMDDAQEKWEEITIKNYKKYK